MIPIDAIPSLVFVGLVILREAFTSARNAFRNRRAKKEIEAHLENARLIPDLDPHVFDRVLARSDALAGQIDGQLDRLANELRSQEDPFPPPFDPRSPRERALEEENALLREANDRLRSERGYR